MTKVTSKPAQKRGNGTTGKPVAAAAVAAPEPDLFETILRNAKHVFEVGFEVGGHRVTVSAMAPGSGNVFQVAVADLSKAQALALLISLGETAPEIEDAAQPEEEAVPIEESSSAPVVTAPVVQPAPVVAAPVAQPQPAAAPPAEAAEDVVTLKSSTMATMASTTNGTEALTALIQDLGSQDLDFVWDCTRELVEGGAIPCLQGKAEKNIKAMIAGLL